MSPISCNFTWIGGESERIPSHHCHFVVVHAPIVLSLSIHSLSHSCQKMCNCVWECLQLFVFGTTPVRTHFWVPASSVTSLKAAYELIGWVEIELALLGMWNKGPATYPWRRNEPNHLQWDCNTQFMVVLRDSGQAHYQDGKMLSVWMHKCTPHMQGTSSNQQDVQFPDQFFER